MWLLADHEAIACGHANEGSFRPHAPLYGSQAQVVWDFSVQKLYSNFTLY